MRKPAAKRSVRMGDVPTTGLSGDGDPVVLEIELFYDEGGANYFTGGTTKRGYYVSVSPVTVGKTFRSSTMFSGLKSLVVEANRFSASKLDDLSSSGAAGDAAAKLIPVVASKKGLTLK